MRIFLKLFFLTTVSASFAQESSVKIHELHFGVNLTRLVVEDYELIVAYRLSEKTIIGLSAGYDANAGEKYFVEARPEGDTTNWKVGHETGSLGYNKPTSRYFYGEGVAFRLSYENLYLEKKKYQGFRCLEVMLKTRDYNNYRYLEHNDIFLESSRQKIYGVTFYGGRYIELHRTILLKYFGGLGVRYLRSNVTRPGGYTYSNQWVPGEKFLYELIFPSVHLGLSLIINTSGTGAPRVEN